MKKAIFIIVLSILCFTAKAQNCNYYLYSVGCYSSTLGDFRIDSLSFGTYNNITGNTCLLIPSLLGFSGSTPNPTYLLQGNTYNLKLKVLSPMSSNYIKVWIDYDRNGQFNDTNELIYQLNNVGSGFYNQDITIPPLLDSGIYRMRTRLVAGTNFNTACDTATYGEFHEPFVHLGSYKLAVIDSLISPFDSVVSYYPNYPKVKLRNTGTTTISYLKINYKINNGLLYNNLFTDTLHPGDSAYFTFSTPFTVPGSNFYICFNVIFDSTTSYSYSTYCKYVIVKPPEHEVGIEQLLSPGATLVYNTPLIVSICIKNNGTSTETSIPVYYQRGTQTPVAEIWNGVLLPGDTAHYTFQTTFIIPLYASFNLGLCAWTSLSGDPNTTNNKLCRTICVGCDPPSTPGAISSIPSGIHHVNTGQILTFYIHPAIGATSYLWNCSATETTIIRTDTLVNIIFNAPLGSYYINVRGYNNWGYSNCSPNYTIDIVDGINESSKANNMKLSPNPTSDKLTIKYNFIKKGKTKFNIFNIHGSILFNEEELIKTDTYTKIIEVGNLKAGIYFIKIENEAGVYNNKFVKE